MRPVEGLRAGDLVERRVGEVVPIPLGCRFYVVDEVREREFDARRVMTSGGTSRFSHTFRNDGELWRRMDAPWL